MNLELDRTDSMHQCDLSNPLLPRLVFVATFFAIGASCGGTQPRQEGQALDGSHPDSIQNRPTDGSSSDTIQKLSCRNSANSQLTWSAALSNPDCTNGTLYAGDCGGFHILVFESTNISQVDPYEAFNYYDRTTGHFVAETFQGIGPVSCILGPADGFSPPDCGGVPPFASLCSTDGGVDAEAGMDSSPSQ